MKSKLLISFLVIIFSVTCKAQTKAAPDQNIIMLKQFYTSYITQVASSEGTEKKLDIIKKRYCTAKLLNKIDKEELDSDPFIDAQDADIDWVRTLFVGKDAQKHDVYIVSYMDNYNKKRTVIKLQVINAKITAIL
ncbi:DUF3828 domain-containing protein [Chitinophaga oryziterrae]|uniref:DUF3828 domain-containing protein n=1 Tax=Chitinophaga oryziterrae TaxID=1031224 RepID=A0A6N8J3Q9_9BACT|nr:DUF3828 domain-containing protein [Chitinophaga oryziterrae]MVT39401.1 DUF3828 domain-containing protein [Chitinophaga oryziterrae]